MCGWQEWGGKPDLSAAKPAEVESEGSEGQGVDMVAQREVELRDTRIAELEAKVMRYADWSGGRKGREKLYKQIRVRLSVWRD
jgi:hypothetical protein